MHEGPNMARIAAVVGERARAQILATLMSGRAFTATELAEVANVSRPTASSHLSQLQRVQLVVAQNSGRHRYFRIANAEAAQMLETIMGCAQHVFYHKQFGPRDPQLRRARLCYDHLAGELGVWIYDTLAAQKAFDFTSQGLSLNESGWRRLAKLNIDKSHVAQTRRPACRACLDWSERRNHLAGSVGALLMERLLERRWGKVSRGSRIVHFSVAGERALRRAFL